VRGQAGRRAREIELDHLGRTGADEKQKPDIRAALEELRDDSIELGVRIRESCEIPFPDDGRREPRFGKDHHAGGRLDEMRASARADDQKERILNLAVKPDDARQTAEHLALAALGDDLRAHEIAPGTAARR
jgi:hypothetical protein